jgi:hypothetical protein
VKVGGGVKWSEDAWKRAALAWESHGRENHLLFPSPQAETNTTELAENCAKRYGIQLGMHPPVLRDEELNARQRDELNAYKFMFEYGFYRTLSNFPHHYNRSFVESNPETVACRKLFDRAEQLTLAGSPTPALALYLTPMEAPAWRGRKLSPLDAWRELVLLKNKEYRRDSYTQEQTAEYQIRFMLLYNRFTGKRLKEDVGRMAPVLPLVPKFTHDTFRPPVFEGPFDRTDPEGHPLIPEMQMDLTLERMHLPRLRKREFTPPPGMRPGMRPGAPPGRLPPPTARP